MKTAQELRLGNVFMVGKDPMVVVNIVLILAISISFKN